ncbi:hypothetical protein [Micromonospora sp. MH33]|uniref:hypothetical protein n=1 Tax=Micromonospora sp. MH33 TaxID=1945509 RepID=UPI0011B25A8E|nr:hypothetical protein [Micromonospora sp. MH33]
MAATVHQRARAVVLDTLEEAVEDTGAPSAAIGVIADAVSVVLAPDVDQVVPKVCPPPPRQ